MASSNSAQVCKGVVKQVLSGDAVIVRGQPRGGPPPERQINFSSVMAPKLARRATSNAAETLDEPYAFESREFLRKKVVGKEVLFTVETKTPTGREYGAIYLGKDMGSAENIVETMVSEGLLTVRQDSIRGESKLIELEEEAKKAGKGKWAGDGSNHVRSVKWTVENPRAFVDKAKNKPIDAVVEHVRDGSTVRVLLLPSMDYVTLMISGIRCPMNKLDSDGRVDPSQREQFADEALYYTESRLLQRDVQVILETFNNNNLVGTILHPNGNIAEMLLKEGFGRCVDWSMATVTGGAAKLRQAESSAKEKKLRLWLNYNPSGPKIDEKDKAFSAKVMEIVNGDALMVKKGDAKPVKIFLSSIRPPRQPEGEARPAGKQFRPLYDIPWMYEAREFLRTKLIGNRVNVTVDFLQPAQNNYPEKTCCTVRIGDVNVAEAMVSKGLATVVRYRQDDDTRSSCYDELLSAEAKAVKGNKGLHNKKDIPFHRIADLSGDVSKAKNFLPFLQRAGRTDALVEFVASGSRFRVFIPKESIIVTFLLAGISCPRGARPAPGGAGGQLPGEPFGDEAMVCSKSLIMQREVQIEVDSQDKGGNFIGWLHIGKKNLSIHLVEQGLASVHPTAEATKFYHLLTAAEKQAKQQKLNLWKNWVEPVESDEPRGDDAAPQGKREPKYKPMMISDVSADGTLCGQYSSDGQAIQDMMGRLKEEMTAKPPLAPHFPKRGELLVGKFVDGEWYRAKVEKVAKNEVSLRYIDYGNREVVDASRCAPLPMGFTKPDAFAHQIRLACVKFPKDEEYLEDAVARLMEEVMKGEVLCNTEYKNGGVEFVSLQRKDTSEDVAASLLRQGLLLVEERRDRRMAALLEEYRAAVEEAKRKHLNIWQYGDCGEDDAAEFGMER